MLFRNVHLSIVDAGKGKVDVTILDPHGRKDSVRPAITAMPDQEGVYLVEYVPREAGLHSINVFFAGHQIPNSPFGVNVAPGQYKLVFKGSLVLQL